MFAMNLFNSTLYSCIGILFFILGYKILVALLKRKKIDLNFEIDNHNISAGFAVGGMFIAIAIVISGVIQ